MNNDEHTTLLREAARHLRSATGIHDYPVAVAMDRAADELEAHEPPTEAEETNDQAI